MMDKAILTVMQLLLKGGFYGLKVDIAAVRISCRSAQVAVQTSRGMTLQIGAAINLFYSLTLVQGTSMKQSAAGFSSNRPHI